MPYLAVCLGLPGPPCHCLGQSLGLPDVVVEAGNPAPLGGEHIEGWSLWLVAPGGSEGKAELTCAASGRRWRDRLASSVYCIAGKQLSGDCARHVRHVHMDMGPPCGMNTNGTTVPPAASAVRNASRLERLQAR